MYKVKSSCLPITMFYVYCMYAAKIKSAEFNHRMPESLEEFRA